MMGTWRLLGGLVLDCFFLCRFFSCCGIGALRGDMRCFYHMSVLLSGVGD